MPDEDCIFRIIGFKKRNDFSGYLFERGFVDNIFICYSCE